VLHQHPTLRVSQENGSGIEVQHVPLNAIQICREGTEPALGQGEEVDSVTVPRERCRDAPEDEAAVDVAGNEHERRRCSCR